MDCHCAEHVTIEFSKVVDRGSKPLLAEYFTYIMWILRLIHRRELRLDVGLASHP